MRFVRSDRRRLTGADRYRLHDALANRALLLGRRDSNGLMTKLLATKQRPHSLD